MSFNNIHAQALFVLLFLPFLSNLKGIPVAKLPSYLMRGAGCFLNVGAEIQGKLLNLIAVNTCFAVIILNCMNTTFDYKENLLLHAGCEGAPLLPLLYVVTNLSFNITLLSLVKKSSAVLASLVVMLSGTVLRTFFFLVEG